MYILNKYCHESKLIQSLCYGSLQKCKDYFDNYIDQFVKTQSNTSVDYYYEQSEEHMYCDLYKKDVLISSGYFFNYVTYSTKLYETFSIAYHSTHSINNVRMNFVIVNRPNEILTTKYDQCIRELKQNKTFCELKNNLK